MRKAQSDQQADVCCYFYYFDMFRLLLVVGKVLVRSVRYFTVCPVRTAMYR